MPPKAKPPYDLARLWRKLGLADGITLSINSIGDAPERREHRALLIGHF